MKTVKKNQKPIDIDAYFKYRCPNPDCGQEKWINLSEAKTKNFKIVCYCGLIIRPKLIENIQITYKEIENNIPEINTADIVVPSIILDKCVYVLKSYGFTNDEANELVSLSYRKTKSDDWKIILKQALESIGVNNEYPTNKF
jgi:hypothetical protein